MKDFGIKCVDAVRDKVDSNLATNLNLMSKLEFARKELDQGPANSHIPTVGRTWRQAGAVATYAPSQSGRCSG